MTQSVHYPEMPPRLVNETDDEYTDRLTGADQSGNRPYNHPRGRQCSIGYHAECSQRTEEGSTIGAVGLCHCPHHLDPRLAAGLPHLVEFAEATARGELLHPVDSAVVDVVVAALADMDAPLRALSRHWRLIGGVFADQADVLDAVLEGRSRFRDGRWVIDHTAIRQVPVVELPEAPIGDRR